MSGIALPTRTKLLYASSSLGGEAMTRSRDLMSAVAIGTMLASLPFFSRLARRASKRHAFRVAMPGSAAVFPLA